MQKLHYTLISAIKYNDLDTVKSWLSINDRVDLDIQDEYGSTVLTYTAERGYFDVVQYLVENGNTKDY